MQLFENTHGTQHIYEHLASSNIVVTDVGKSLNCFRKRQKKTLVAPDLPEF